MLNDHLNPQMRAFVTAARAAKHMDCAHLGTPQGKQVCGTCVGHTTLTIFECALHGRCTIGKSIADAHCCRTCGDYQQQPILIGP